MNKSRLFAFLLAFIPGFGHIYLNRKVRGVLYGLGFAGSLGLAFILAILFPYNDFLIALLLALGIWMVNMFDMVITLLSGSVVVQREQGILESDRNQNQQKRDEESQDRFLTIVLSFIPGVGHFHLGLNYRGLTFLTGFLGLGTMILFVTILTSQPGFLIFVLGLPIIWIYSLFDTIQLLNKQQNGEELMDRSIMEDFEQHRASEGKSKAITTVLSIFPGAGHMYLGLQKRGLQLMIGFLLSIYILDALRISLFLFLVPVIWFFSFFDALQQQSRHEIGEAKDVPIIGYFANHQRWLGIGLIVLGIFFIVDSILMPVFGRYMTEVFQIDIRFYYQRYLQLAVVCLLLIGGGIRLLMGSKGKDKGGED
ncbi:hypothetical protein SAMN05421676_107111 [Salinibacillus kushneri]|uniref:Multi-TM2 domain-containing protein n=1 Tax=Salinibacillus kushneri TaxID=237682 RepID=A0A1I0GPE5_9BACI|nr:hypothetical protein [Salinibacillus kushneri]SET73210.1 hypothetical protein SAMN05421676_107111 [Salinibacillus kushneri]